MKLVTKKSELKKVAKMGIDVAWECGIDEAGIDFDFTDLNKTFNYSKIESQSYGKTSDGRPAVSITASDNEVEYEVDEAVIEYAIKAFCTPVTIKIIKFVISGIELFSGVQKEFEEFIENFSKKFKFAEDSEEKNTKKVEKTKTTKTTKPASV